MFSTPEDEGPPAQFRVQWFRREVWRCQQSPLDEALQGEYGKAPEVGFEPHAREPVGTSAGDASIMVGSRLLFHIEVVAGMSAVMTFLRRSIVSPPRPGPAI